MLNNALRMIAKIAADKSIITPSTTIIPEISMAYASIPSIITNIGINRCRIVVTTIIITVVVTSTTITMIAITTIITIITKTMLFLLPLLTSCCKS